METKDEVLEAIANDPEVIALIQEKNLPDLTSFPNFDEAICYIAKNGYTEIARLFLKHQPIDPLDFCSLPLTLAAQNNHMDMVKLFLFEKERGWHFQARIKFNNNATAIHPLLWATQNALINVVKLYLDRYCKEYELEHESHAHRLSILQQAYLEAIRQQQIEIVRLLLDDESIDPNKGYKGSAPLVIAVMTGNLSLLNLLLLDDRFDHYDAAIEKACELGNMEMLQLLKKYETRFEEAIEMYHSCKIIKGLKLAIDHKHLPIILYLLEQPNIPLQHVFFWSVENNLIAIIQLLLPKIDPQFNKSICLREAAKRGFDEIVACLLKDGRSKPETFGNQALRDAAAKGHIAIVKMLLEDPRVNPGARENYALSKATEGDYHEIVKLLLPRVDVKIRKYKAGLTTYTSWSVLKVYINDKRLNLELEALPELCYQVYKKMSYDSDLLMKFVNLYSWLPWSEKLVQNLIKIADDQVNMPNIKTTIKVAKMLNTCGIFRLAKLPLLPENRCEIENFMIAALNKAVEPKTEETPNMQHGLGL